MRKAILYLTAYIAWLAACAGGFVTLLLARAAINQLSLLALLPRTTFRLLDQVGLFILGLACLILLVLSEAYFREAVERGVLARRIVTVFAIEAGLSAVFYTVPVLVAAML